MSIKEKVPHITLVNAFILSPLNVSFVSNSNTMAKKKENKRIGKLDFNFSISKLTSLIHLNKVHIFVDLFLQ